MLNYPIKFEPILKQKIWGGDKLVTKFNKKSRLKNIGESWEISDVDGNISEVSNGAYKGSNLKELIEIHGADFLGAKNFKNLRYIDFGSGFKVPYKEDDIATDIAEFGQKDQPRQARKRARNHKGHKDHHARIDARHHGGIGVGPHRINPARCPQAG